MSKVIREIKGTDAKGQYFTVFLLCTEEESKRIAHGEISDLTKFEILYTHLGHDVPESVYNDLHEYIRLGGTKAMCASDIDHAS